MCIKFCFIANRHYKTITLRTTFSWTWCTVELIYLLDSNLLYKTYYFRLITGAHVRGNSSSKPMAICHVMWFSDIEVMSHTATWASGQRPHASSCIIERAGGRNDSTVQMNLCSHGAFLTPTHKSSGRANPFTCPNPTLLPFTLPVPTIHLYHHFPLSSGLWLLPCPSHARGVYAVFGANLVQFKFKEPYLVAA